MARSYKCSEQSLATSHIPLTTSMLLPLTAQGRLPYPTSVERPHSSSSGFRPRPFLSRRFRGPLFCLVVLVAISILFHLGHFFNSIPDDMLILLQDLLTPEGGWYPPRFLKWHDREKRLPQHDLDLPYPQGRKGRYVRFSNQVCCTFPQSILCYFVHVTQRGPCLGRQA